MGSYFADIEGIESEVEFYGTPEMVDNGIGPYECHGYKGHDVRMEPQIESVEWDKKDYTPEENSMIDKFVSDNLDYICERIIENHDFERDYPEGNED